MEVKLQPATSIQLVPTKSLNSTHHDATLGLYTQLNHFHQIQKIPNILFNGPCSRTKHALLANFMTLIYGDDPNIIRQFIMNVNCAHGKGIKFIRDELKFFAKSHIDSRNGTVFKSVILANGDKLTQDAQSALRRCIELYNHNTRFFITIEDKNKLLKPILSRFCEMYVPEPPAHRHRRMPVQACIEQTRENIRRVIDVSARLSQLKRYIHAHLKPTPFTAEQLIELAQLIYDKGYSAVDLIQLVDRGGFSEFLSDDKKIELIVFIENIRHEIRSEWFILVHILYYVFVNSSANVLELFLL